MKSCLCGFSNYERMNPEILFPQAHNFAIIIDIKDIKLILENNNISIKK